MREQLPTWCRWAVAVGMACRAMLAAGGVEVVGGTVVDLGAYPNWESREAVFQLRNNGNVPIHLERVRPACTCAIVRQPPRSLPPNTVTELRVEMLAKSLNGAFTRYLYVQTDDPETPLLNLTITGTATPLVAVSPREYVYVDRLPLTWHAWQFRLTPADSDVLLGDPYLAIARPPTLALQFTRAAGGILALTVTLPAAPPPGDLECTVAVPVERPEGHAHVNVGITGKLGDELYCLPAAVQLPLATNALSRLVQVRLATPDAGRVLRADELRWSELPGLAVRESTAVPAGGVQCVLVFAPEFLRRLAREKSILLTVRTGDDAWPRADLECRHLPHGLIARPVR